METQILKFEKEYWQAMEDRDYDTVKRLTRFPCLVAGKHGIREVDEATFKTMFDSSENMYLKVIDITSVHTQQINAQTAIIAYQIQQEYRIDGQNSRFNCACSSTWVRENEEWLCAMHTETELLG